jgi:peptidylprolyl isomerase
MEETDPYYAIENDEGTFTHIDPDGTVTITTPEETLLASPVSTPISISVVSTPDISAPDDYVEVDYTGSLSNGEVFDSSIGYEPLGFVIASGAMIPGFDEAVRGMAVGETKTVTILSEDAYGDWTEEMVISIPRDIPTEEEEPPVAGEVIYLFGGMGFVPVTVLEVTDEVIIVDANHQLAGEDLTFEITMLKIVKPDNPEHPYNAVSTDDSLTEEFVIEVPES